MPGSRRPVPKKDENLVLGKECDDARGQSTYDLVLARDHGRDVHAHIAGGNAVFFQFLLAAMEVLGRFQQRLGGDAAHVETGAAERGFAFRAHAAVDARDAHTELRGPDCGYVTGWTSPQNDQVECLRHDHTLKINRVGSSMSSLTATRNSTGLSSVNDAMIVGQGQVHHGPNHNLVPFGHRTRLDAMETQDRNFAVGSESASRA